MPRTTRIQEPGDPRMPRRSGQDASSPSTTADSQAGGRRPRARSTERESPAADAASRSPEQPAAPAYDDIARRAYELYQERGGNEGQDIDDWLRAEAELRDRGLGAEPRSGVSPQGPSAGIDFRREPPGAGGRRDDEL